MKNLNEMKMEELNSNEMISTRGGEEYGDDYQDGRGGDAIRWEV